MKKTLLVKAFTLISVVLFAQKQFLNADYKLQKQPLKIAVVPYLKNDDTYFQAIVASLATDSLSNISLADVNTIAHHITSDSLTNFSINKIAYKQYTDQELKSHPNLSSLLSEQTISYLQRMLDTTDLLLVPSSIKLRTVTKINGKGNSTLYGGFRLYDLNSGDLIFSVPVEKKVDYLIESTDVKKQMEVLLESFHSYYLKNFIIRNNIK